MDYTQGEQAMAWASLRSMLGRRTAVDSARHPKLIRLPPGKQYALEWRIEAAHRVQAGRQLLSQGAVSRLADHLPDDRTGLAEGLIYRTFRYPDRQIKRKKEERIEVDIVPILWHLPAHLTNVLAAEILANPGFDEVELERWLDKYQIDRAQPLPDLKHMTRAQAKA